MNGSAKHSMHEERNHEKGSSLLCTIGAFFSSVVHGVRPMTVVCSKPSHQRESASRTAQLTQQAQRHTFVSATLEVAIGYRSGLWLQGSGGDNPPVAELIESRTLRSS